jgi:hypothetical protein
MHKVIYNPYFDYDTRDKFASSKEINRMWGIVCFTCVKYNMTPCFDIVSIITHHLFDTFEVKSVEDNCEAYTTCVKWDFAPEIVT